MTGSSISSERLHRCSAYHSPKRDSGFVPSTQKEKLRSERIRFFAGEAIVQFAEDSVDQQDVAIKFYANNATFKAETSWLHKVTLGSVAMTADDATSAGASQMGGGDSLTGVPPSKPELSNQISSLPAQHWLRLKSQQQRRAASVVSGATDRSTLLKMLPRV